MARLGKDDLVEALAKKTGLEKQQAEKVLDALPGLVADALAAGDTVAIPGLGRFERKWREPRRYGHPRTGDVREAPGHFAPDFRPFRNLAERMEAVPAPKKKG